MNRGSVPKHRRQLFAMLSTLATGALLVGADMASAQPDASIVNARAQLLGASKRVWVKERVEVSMGSHGICTKGETYHFEISGQVRIRKCENGVLTTRSVAWALSRKDSLDPTLAFDGSEYRLSFGGTSRAPKMRWRNPSMRKPTATSDIYLGLSRD